MSIVRVTKEFTWEMAHALDFHNGKCKNIHGHTYTFSITCIGKPLFEVGHPKDGMVIDFANLKSIVKTHVVDIYDHSLILQMDSPYLKNLIQMENIKLVTMEIQPTCENILIKIVEILKNKFKNIENTKLYSASLQETKTSKVEWFTKDNNENT